MTDVEFAAALRSMHRETEAERSARLDSIADELAELHAHEFAAVENPWNSEPVS